MLLREDDVMSYLRSGKHVMMARSPPRLELSSMCEDVWVEASD